MKKTLLLMLAVFLVLNCSEDNVLSYEDQLIKDTKIIDKYLAKNGITAMSDPTGLRFVIEDPGTGSYPTLDSKLTVIYTGKFLSNGTIFGQSGNPPEQLALQDLIPAWQIGFSYVAKGGKATFYVPSGLGYGPKGKGSIPGNANLIFDVELIGFSN